MGGVVDMRLKHCRLLRESHQFVYASVDSVKAEDKTVMYQSQSHNIDQLRGYIAQHRLQGQTELLYDWDIAAVKTCVIGLQQLRYNGSCGTEDRQKQNDDFGFPFFGRRVKLQKHDQQKRQHYQIVKCDCVEIQIILEEILDVAAAVYQTGIDYDQPEGSTA